MGMGLFDKKKVLCPPGVWTNVIWNFGSGYAKTFDLRLTTTSGEPVAGEFRERRALWIFPEAPVTGALADRMEFHRKWINAYYTLSVRPEKETWVEVF